ncbi:DNA ligase D [Lysinibacillus cavernae]|uniref:DNA ligase D n=1 Tax=Lysinibacillus cavernae TaxID=2666135 RepID=UPI0012D8ED73|nr:DNA ligase D [Lysinibacillus cavernae]
MPYTAFFTIIGFCFKSFEYDVAVVQNNIINTVGSFKDGLNKVENKALLDTLMGNKISHDKNYLKVSPGICVELQYSHFKDGKVHNLSFLRFSLEKSWQECTWQQLLDNKMHIRTEITHPDKRLFIDNLMTKKDYIKYLQEIAPYMLPFLKNRLLTVIRYPHGLFGESFYQKECPDYAPAYIETYKEGSINHILCNSEEALIWLGNQLAFEFHVPFETIFSKKNPTEIVFDLDPPSKDHFKQSIYAANMLKEIFDNLNLTSFVKTSGNKGMQVYIPLSETVFSYSDVRLFTEFIAKYLISLEPNLFTIERLKKNRSDKLYIDYVQHGSGKTIIAPFSIRGNNGGTVACPLYWEEVNDNLSPDIFTINEVISKIGIYGNPFDEFFSTTNNTQPFKRVLDFISKR